MMDDRAVSEVLGFVLAFGIIIASVGLLSMVGFDSMESYQVGEQTTNADRAMDALAENFNDIQRNDGVPARSSEITLRGGTIQTVEDSTALLIEVDSEDDPGEVDLGAFEYEYEGTTFAYEGGAVVRSVDDDDFISSEPMIRCDEDDVAIVSLIEIVGDTPSLYSEQTHEITAERVNTDVYRYTDDDVTIEATGGSYENGWDEFLDETGFDDGCEVDRATVRITTVEIDY